MRIEIWFNNNNDDGLMRGFPNVKEDSLDRRDDTLCFEASGHQFEVNMKHVMFVECMPEK